MSAAPVAAAGSAARTAVVLGATGLVGRALVAQLAAAAHVDRVVAITRRPLSGLPSMPSSRVLNRVVDFEKLDDHADALQGRWLFSALGTTRKQAGSIAAQRRVDVDYQLHAARLAADNGVQHCLLVSSALADARSRNAYIRMKGELEQAVQALGFPRISIFQPGVLAGARETPRPLEAAGAALLARLGRLPGLAALRPIAGSEVAARMVQVSATNGTGTQWFRRAQVFLP